MSRKHRKSKQTKGFPWALVAFGGVLIVAAFVVFALRSGGGGGNDSGGAPAIAVDPQNPDLVVHVLSNWGP